MKGYIVGYTESWVNDVNTVIIGYFTTWNRAVNIVKKTEHLNKTLHGGFQSVYLVEIDVNKVYPKPESPFWYQSFNHYTIKHDDEKTLLVPVTGKPIVL